MWDFQVPAVSATDVGDEAFLLDVREVDEWVAGHAPAAYHVPMMEVPARMAEVPQDAQVVVVCRSGVRSARVVAYLAGNGHENVRNLSGGMHDWLAAGRPLVSEDGQQPRII